MPTVLDAIDNGIVKADQAALSAYRYELVPAAARGDSFDSRRVQRILKEANKTPDNLREEAREMKERLEVFNAKQANADALRQADELKSTIASKAAVLHAATADLRAQIKEVEQPFLEELKQLNDERHALLDGIYYRGNRPPVGDGRHLRWLLNRFRPATTVDRDLIQGAIMTPLWGGAAGRRPAFVFTSDDGRGAGKTTVAEMIGRIYGGIVDVSAGEDIQTLKTRLLSPASRTCRIGLIDNIKTMRLSWAELEALITSPVISGRQLFVGEGQRPNLLTWFLSLNGVSMATDMAQRSVIVKVVKGENAGDWHEVTTRYIDDHRDQLIGDVIGALRAEKFPLANYSRWSTWESEVLCRLPEPGEAQRLILERQGEANCELEEGEIIEQYFADQLASFGYDPNTAQVRIPTTSAAYWFAQAVGEAMKSTAASRRLHQMSREKQLKRISEDTTRTYGRGFLWTGPAADVFGGSIDNNLASLIAERLERAR